MKPTNGSRRRRRKGEASPTSSNRISPDVRLEDYWGILDDQAAEEFRETIEGGREHRRATRAVPCDRIAAELASDETNHEQ
jgi:hypothetical protein